LGSTSEQIPRKRQQQRCLAGTWGTEYEQGVVEAIKDVDEARTRRLHVVDKVGTLHVEVQGAGDHGRSCGQAQIQ
jgi:hypothetical protein